MVEWNVINYIVVGLKRNEIYCVRIFVYNENGDGYFSDCVEVMIVIGNVIYFWYVCIWSFI